MHGHTYIKFVIKLLCVPSAITDRHRIWKAHDALTYHDTSLTLDIPSLARQRYLPSWGPRRTPWFFFFLISQLFDAVDYSNYVFWVSGTIIQ